MKKEQSTTSLTQTPFVSVIVPAFNEESTIINTLKSINNLDYPKKNIEVIVIDDGSTDLTKHKIQNFIKNKSHFSLISHKNMGKGPSMNKALKIIKGEYFACLDADSFVEPLTLRKMLAMYQKENDPRLAIITPAMKVHKPKNLLQKVQWLEYNVIILIARLSSHLDSLYVAPGPFSLYRTDIIRTVGGFHTDHLTEDQEIAYRLQKAHYRIKQCFDGYVFTNAPDKIKPFYAQRRRWYLGSLQCVHGYRSLIGNKKYGDFGIMQMSKNIAGYSLALFGIITAVYFLIRPLLRQLQDLSLINFDIFPYLVNLQLKFTFLNFLINDFRKGVVLLSIMIIGYLFFYLAHKNAKEKAMNFGLIALIPYFAFYYVLKGTILLLSLVEFAQGKKIRWR